MEKADIKKWSDNIFSALKNISDLDNQRLIWNGKLSNYVSSFTEDINILYDDNAFEEYISFLLINKLGTELFISKLVDLNEMINGYLESGNKTDNEVLLDPKWIAITKKAGDIIENWGNGSN